MIAIASSPTSASTVIRKCPTFTSTTSGAASSARCCLGNDRDRGSNHLTMLRCHVSVATGCRQWRKARSHKATYMTFWRDKRIVAILATADKNTPPHYLRPIQLTKQGNSTILGNKQKR